MCRRAHGEKKKKKTGLKFMSSIGFQASIIYCRASFEIIFRQK